MLAVTVEVTVESQGHMVVAVKSVNRNSTCLTFHNSAQVKLRELEDCFLDATD